MANTLTGLIPNLYEAAQIVSRELVGYVPASGAMLGSTPAAVNEKIRIPVAPSADLIDITPSMNLTDPADLTMGYVDVEITKSKSAPFAFTGEEQKGLDNGPGHMSLQTKMIAEAMRKLTNAVESDIALAAALGASRAYGTAGTTPFASNLKDTAQIKKILKDNGAPQSDLQLVMDTSAGANVLSLTQLTNVNQSGDQSLLRQGLLTSAPVHGFSLRETGQGVEHTAGTGTLYTTDTAGYAVGATDITVITGTGTILAGDFVTFAGDDNKYMIETALTGGVIKLTTPGLLEAIPAAATAVTVGGSYAANVAFDRNAIQLIARPPAMPKEGDIRMDSTIIQDPMSGLAFEVSVWPGTRKVRYEVSLAWGVKVIQPRHAALLLG